MARGEDVLLISGLQHLAFCARQWALIHMERQWQENVLTAQGQIMHEKVHSGGGEGRPGVIMVRGLHLISETLGLYGIADSVEFYSDTEGISLHGRKGRWRPFPVEYKRGSPKKSDCDRIQLCAQALCLEEMFCVTILHGALFYGEPRRREDVLFDKNLRHAVKDLCVQARQLLEKEKIPPPKLKPYCRSCSMKHQCLPEIQKTARGYIERSIKEALNETPSEYFVSES